MTSPDSNPKRIKVDPSIEFLEKLKHYKRQLGDYEEVDDIVIPIYFEPKLFTDCVFAKVQHVSLRLYNFTIRLK